MALLVGIGADLAAGCAEGAPGNAGAGGALDTASRVNAGDTGLRGEATVSAWGACARSSIVTTMGGRTWRKSASERASKA